MCVCWRDHQSFKLKDSSALQADSSLFQGVTWNLHAQDLWVGARTSLAYNWRTDEHKDHLGSES
jgi:hypothetical protein